MPACGKGQHQVCVTTADCPPGEFCRPEPGGYGLCARPKVVDGGTGDGGGDAAAPSDATVE
jgi:hypothetical protein